MLIRSIQRLLRSPRLERRESVTTVSQVIWWWEGRRTFFNWAVGCAGLVTCAAMVLCATVSTLLGGEPIGIPDPPIVAVFGVVLYGIAANVCYTAGWVIEAIYRKAMKAEASAEFGPRLLRAGVVFSVLLTLAPIGLLGLFFVVAMVSWV